MGLLIIALFAGTLMPGPWRYAMEAQIHGPSYFASAAHFVLFCCGSALAIIPPIAWRRVQVLGFALLLALLTEGLQFFAVQRHPRWADVGIDMAGAMAGVLFAGMVLQCFVHRSGSLRR